MSDPSAAAAAASALNPAGDGPQETRPAKKPILGELQTVYSGLEQRKGEGVFTLSDARSFSGLTSKIPPLGSMLNFDADVKKRPRVTYVITAEFTCWTFASKAAACTSGTSRRKDPFLVSQSASR